MIDSRSVESWDGDVDRRHANARRFKALGDPTRLGIVELLGGGTRCVCEIQERLGVAGNLLSHHLKVLREAGLVEAERRGRWIDYRLDRDGCDAVAAALPPTTSVPREAGCACTRDGASA